MKSPKTVFLTAVALFVAAPWVHAQSAAPSQGALTEVSHAAKPFLGRWDLTLKTPTHEYPSWLEVREEDGQLRAQMVGRWGNARPLPRVEISKGVLTFVSPKEEEGSQADLVFQGKVTGRTLSGTLNGPDGTTWHWVGEKAPALARAHEPKWGKPIALFNGKDLSGWKTDETGAAKWTVRDGLLISPGNGPELIGVPEYRDFKLHIEFKCDEESNSGVYLRGRYEVQVETDSVAEPPSHHTGAVYGFLAPTPEQPRQPGVWQTFDITLLGRNVTVVQNGVTVIDHQDIPGITGGALDSKEALPGPIYLQGSEKGHVAYRNIILTPAE